MTFNLAISVLCMHASQRCLQGRQLFGETMHGQWSYNSSPNVIET